MRIGLVSDTHGSVPPEVKDVFKDVDLILHAGDICDSYLWPLDQMEVVAPVLAAKGDEDSQNVLSDKRVKLRHSLSIEGINLTLIHEIESEGFPSGQIIDYKSVKPELFKNAMKVCMGGISDIYIFGHFHKPVIDVRNGFLFINPGSATQPDHELRADKLGTIGILDIASDKIEIRIVPLGNGVLN
jgi:uncharacterized protein